MPAANAKKSTTTTSPSTIEWAQKAQENVRGPFDPTNRRAFVYDHHRIYNRLNGSMSTKTAVCGMLLASQYAIAPLNILVSRDRLGDFSRNWKRCSFFKRARGAVAGPRIRAPFPSCGPKYSESCRDHTMAFSKLVSRTITFARDVNGGYCIIRRKCISRSKNAEYSWRTAS